MKIETFRIATLGCRANQYEAQALRDQLEALGYRQAAKEEAADLCIVNTCLVTESAEQRSRYQLRLLARQNPGAKIVATGCMSQSAQNLEEVDVVVDNQEKHKLLSHIFPQIHDLPEFAIKRFEGHTRAFVKIQDGCNSFCSYCIIPYVRGRSRSRKPEEILAEIRGLIANGYKEIVITGINIGDYEGGLASLVKAIDDLEGLERLRLSSVDPTDVDEELIEVIINGKRTCHQLHLVLQSGSNAILKKMNRKYNRQQFLKTVESLRARDPDFVFTTDVIIGFPGETQADFEDTLEIIRRAQFAHVHFFPYSPRPGTYAAKKYLQKVPDAVVKSRKNDIAETARKAKGQLLEGYRGRSMVVLTEKRLSEKLIVSRAANFLEVFVEDDKLFPNQLVAVEVVDVSDDGLEAKVKEVSL
ncbi:MAG: tRNA (N(6)-L-threonylcarbamoyladenosine(37)-C(2))-methylthiotransferase MtaB [Chlamydiota bacterium]